MTCLYSYLCKYISILCAHWGLAQSMRGYTLHTSLAPAIGQALASFNNNNCNAFLFQFTIESALDVIYDGKLYIEEGTPFNITCIRSAYGSPKWYKNGLIIDHLSKEFNFTEENIPPSQIMMSLGVEDALWRHRGDYKCDTLSEKFHRIEIVPSSSKYTFYCFSLI